MKCLASLSSSLSSFCSWATLRIRMSTGGGWAGAPEKVFENPLLSFWPLLQPVWWASSQNQLSDKCGFDDSVDLNGFGATHPVILGKSRFSQYGIVSTWFPWLLLFFLILLLFSLLLLFFLLLFIGILFSWVPCQGTLGIRTWCQRLNLIFIAAMVLKLE